MADDDLHEQISRLEAEIENLAGAAERCRRIGFMARAAIACGGTWTLAILAGAARLDAAAVVGVTTLIVGGIVVFGSNASTEKQIVAAIKAAEALRTEAIGRIAFGAFPPRDMHRIAAPNEASASTG